MSHDLQLNQQWSLAGQSIREQIMAALLVRAQSLVATAGRDPVRTPVDQLPRMVIQDQQEVKDAPLYKRHQLRLSVVAEITDYIDVRTQTVSVIGNRWLADLIAAVMSGDRTLGGLCDGLDYEQSTIDYQDGSDPMIRVTALFSVVYGYPVGNPFAT